PNFATINVTLSDQAPTLLTIRSSLTPNGYNLSSTAGLSSNADLLTEYFILVKKWPLSIELPVGKYRFDFLRDGIMAKLCSTQFQVKTEGNLPLSCTVQEKGESPNLSASAD